MVELTSRQRKLARILCRKDGFITVADLARSVDASIRTIRTDLHQIEAFAAQSGVVLERIPGTGVRLNCTAEERKALRLQIGRTDLHTLSVAEQCAVAELFLLLYPW